MPHAHELRRSLSVFMFWSKPHIMGGVFLLMASLANFAACLWLNEVYDSQLRAEKKKAVPITLDFSTVRGGRMSKRPVLVLTRPFLRRA